ncbi:phosphatidylinositide phosphatase SAC1-like [Actinia tenebrosa]|uniref:Phosphatidylinositol-3-phosphatase SAC1 n=1 Tax=Actinia tenebrosa TaxID=6105 RepID=A0A6P8HY43_ACTTE|nr:phosphatidylinositide phosphatase SAC1-like [Actinia tenebrosa]
MADQSIYKTSRLHISPDKFFIEPRDPHAVGEKILEIDRVSQELTLADNEGQIPPSAETKDIFGIMGIIHLLAGPYLIVITRKRLVGYIQGNEVWKVLGTEVFPFPKALLHLTEEQVYYNKLYLSMITAVLQTDGFYFSCTYDLTHTVQRLSRISPDFLQMPLYERVDPRFVWNNHLLGPFTVQPELQKFILPVMHGFISINQCTIKQNSFDFIVISRRSCYRAGVRYYIRGLDEEGRSANFVETEQIIQYSSGTSSFVQIRGSIPLYWSQRPNIKYKPKPVINNNADHSLGFRYHIDNQMAHYGELMLVNLIDQKGPEKVLGDNFSTIIRNSGYPENSLRFDSFDFHKECSKMRWDRLNILIDRLNGDLKKFRYFSMSRDKTIHSEQKGVFRTNCIDSLDRTNVVQSMLATKSLELQFEEYGVLSTGERISEHKEFEFVFKNVWADNADACSVQYAGTGALKTDFTRTGKRSVFGALKDGLNSAIRYYKNNFSDGWRQDSIDLFLGNYVVDSNECVTKPCPLEQKRDWRYMMLPFILLFGFSMFIISLIIPSTDYGVQFLYVVFWGAAVLLTLYVVVFFGYEFVDKPKLVQTVSKDKHV